MKEEGEEKGTRRTEQEVLITKEDEEEEKSREEEEELKNSSNCPHLFPSFCLCCCCNRWLSEKVGEPRVRSIYVLASALALLVMTKQNG